jgi:Tol biopolymer transport system component
MTLEAGTRLGPYEILGPLGAGGMGEVYSARDHRLGRIVAVKVLPERLGRDERLRQRFEREARALATLAHPHICTLHDVGHEGDVVFLVLEHLEGETLSSRLARGALPVAQAVRLGSEIAAALDHAHRRGIVHRDLKPANVMLTREGVKLLDFGLARATTNALGTPAGGLMELPTRSEPLTAAGAIVGTVPYMAPEQLEGRETDPRTDVFALGAVLYEMVSGRRAFAGASAASVMAAILTAEPPRLATVTSLAPPALERAVARCLAKDPEARWQSARDLQLELAWIAEAGAEADATRAAAARPRTAERLAWLAALALLGIGLGWALARSRPPAPPRRPARFTAAPPAAGTIHVARVSPDGRQLSFTATGPSGGSQIWVRPLGELASRPLPGTENAAWHFWSPDSRFVAFFADGLLKRVDVANGTTRAICAAPGAGPFRLGAWGADGTIVFRIEEAPGHPEGLFRVAAEGGEATPLEVVDESGQPLLAVWPSFLPDGRRFLAGCTDPRQTGPPEQRLGVCVVELGTGRARRLLTVPSYAQYVTPGSIAYVEGSSLFVQPFDAETLRLGGKPSPIADGLESWGGVGMPSFSLSDNGVLVYRNLGGGARLTWKDRNGRALGEVGPPGAYEYVRLAPDERRAAVTLRDDRLGLADLWLLELERDVAVRFVPEGPEASFAAWSPDGARLAYCRPDDVAPFLHVKPLAGGAERVLLAAAGTLQCPGDWSPDGRVLLFVDRHASTRADIWALATAPGAEPSPLVRTPAREYEPAFAPDGRSFAYVSDDSGRAEVYLQSYPDPGERVRVSTQGGGLPRWRRDGGELYYEGADGWLFAVTVGPGSPPELGAPTPLFALAAGAGDVIARYDAAADGQRFLVITPEPGATPGATVVLDWAAELAPD